MAADLTYARRWSSNSLRLATAQSAEWAEDWHEQGQAYAVTVSVDGAVRYALSVTGMFGYVSCDHLDESGAFRGTLTYGRQDDGSMSITQVAVPMPVPQDGDKTYVLFPEDGGWHLTARLAHRQQRRQVDVPASWNEARPRFPEFGQYAEFCDPELLDFDLQAILDSAMPL